ncbi:MAG: hypothetical protein COV59_00150 [Candidatus Magasanikbacteria bacterium CG11_big_fil_rev_8_21_14_0_20_39_34]|uniref:Uncharacterized protein n=1 Tax=Candidatus Magasanikbacteria bacterium CG11_big_fil_rev_8_21_14_0_20_39_34 TaxID=1974653 RepID=A0A2H0N8U1_9BACT|nr:MAG: hypothetical protein COV59_00150 [Candidatus Magasanikbacteria bacterium CG11_big_fil_rev_8_21_14_0_20_39_34]
MAFFVNVSRGNPGDFVFVDLSRDGKELDQQTLQLFPERGEQIRAVLDLLSGWRGYGRGIMNLLEDLLRQLGITLPNPIP